MKILLLEPRMNLRTILRGVLNSIDGVSIHTPNTSIDAVKLILSQDVDLLMTSEQSKPIVGDELVKLLRSSKDTTTRRIPTMIITSTNSIEDIKEFLSIGCDEILRIPFSYDAILARVNRVWKQRAKFLELDAYVGPDRRRTEMYGIEPENRDIDAIPSSRTFSEDFTEMVRSYLRDKAKEMEKIHDNIPVKVKGKSAGVVLGTSKKLFNTQEDQNQSLPGVLKKLDDLEPGMSLAENVKSVTGLLVMDTKRTLSEQSILKLRDLLNMGKLEDGFRVYGATLVPLTEKF